MEAKKQVDVLFLGTLQNQTDGEKGQLTQKISHHDEISFDLPVIVQLLRIPHALREMYSRYTSKTQKTPIKGFEVYYRNLTKENYRFSLLASYSSELLASETDDILITLKQTIITDLLVIKGDFKIITLCIYGQVLTDPEEIKEKCPFFFSDIQVRIEGEKPAYQIERSIFDESSKMIKAIENSYYDENSLNVSKLEPLYRKQIFSNDDELHEQQIQNISVLSQQLLQQFSQENISVQHFLVDSRRTMEHIQGHLAKLFKSAHIGLYYPSSYRTSTIQNRISSKIDQIALKSLSLTLSDQCRSLQILKFILQLSTHAKRFVSLGGVKSLIRLFVEFFSTQSVILSSFKALIIQALITLSFWDFAASSLVENIDERTYHSLFIQDESSNNSKISVQKGKKKNKQRSSLSEKSISKEISRSRSRQKRKRKQKSQKSVSSERKKDKKSKKEKKKGKKKDNEKQKKEKDRSKSKRKYREKQQFQAEENKELSIKKDKSQSEQQIERYSFYEIIFRMMMREKNIKLLCLMKILVQQITQTLSKNNDVSNQMAYYTPLLRDTKYMFNQGGQLISSKPLKIFASFQPFLNNEQSKGVDSQFISEIERLKNNSKYEITPKLFKILDSVQTIILSKSEQQSLSCFDQEFITSMSYLLKQNNGSISIGFNNFIDSLKIDNLLTLKKQQASISMICQYIYKILLEDDGLNTVLYMDQMHSSLLKISTWLREDKTFSKQIKKKVRFLKNYVISFDYFSGAENTFKNLADYFLRLIKYQHYEINKIKEYHMKDYNRSINPTGIFNLEENFNFGNLFDLLPSQPLLQIDVCLKIFFVLLKFNKNIWPTFYENKLSCGLASFFLRIYSLLKFYLTPSIEKYQTLIDLKFYEQLLGNYFSVTKRILQIFVQKVRYESAFNELLEEDQDIFDCVEQYEKLIDLYSIVDKTYQNEGSLITDKKVKRKMKQINSLIIQYFQIVLKSFETIKHQSRQIKIKNLLKFMNRLHYESLIYRSSIISLIRILIERSDGHSQQLIKVMFFEGGIRKTEAIQDTFLPNNQFSAIENVIRKNLFTSNFGIKINLAGLIKECLKKNLFKESVIKILETIYEESQQRLKEQFGEEKRNTFEMKKFILLIDILNEIEYSISMKLDDKVLKFFRKTENIMKDFQNKDEFDLYTIELRNCFIKYLANSLQNNENSSLILQYLKIISSFLDIEQQIFGKKNCLEYLKSCLYSLQSLIKISNSSYYQSFILYGDFFSKPYKPNCEISLQKIFNFILKMDEIIIPEQAQNSIQSIIISAFYFICKLTTIDEKVYYSTQSRKNAILELISPDKKINIFEVMNLVSLMIPNQITTTIKNYFDFPVIEKQQTYINEDDKVISQFPKYIGYYFSKSVFNMIGEGDSVSKSRFQFVLQKWEGGDIRKRLFQIENKNKYSIMEQRDKDSAKSHVVQTYDCFLQPEKQIHSEKSHFYNFVAKKTFDQLKKSPADSVINLKNIPKTYLPIQEINKQTLKPSHIVSQNNHSISQKRNNSPLGLGNQKQGQTRSNSLNKNTLQGIQTQSKPNTLSNNYQPQSQPQPQPQPQQLHQQQALQPQQPHLRQSYQNQVYQNVPQNYGGYEMNRGYYAGNYDPRTNYTSNYNNPINYQGQRNIGQIQNNFGQYGNNYRTTYPSQQDLYNEGIQLIFQLKSRPNGSSSEKQKQRLNQILNTSASLHQRINEYFRNIKR